MFIRSTEDLRRAVKINKNTPFEALEPFVHNAVYSVIVPYLGKSLLQSIDESQNDYNATNEQKTAFSLLSRATGTLTLLFYTHEGSISMGDNGHTVQRSSTSAPASDAKIAQVVFSLHERGYLYLDEAISFLIAHEDSFPELKGSPLFLAKQNNYIADVETFERESGFSIHRSELFLYTLRQFMTAIERSSLIHVIGEELDKSLRAQPELHAETLLLIQRYVSVQALAMIAEAPLPREKSIYYVPDCRHIMPYKALLNQMAANCLSVLTGHVTQKYGLSGGGDLNCKESSFFYAL